MLEKPTLRTTWLPLGLAALVLIILNLGLYTRLAPAQAARVVPEFPYYADYSDPDALSSYVPFGGDWEIRDQMLVQLSTSGYDLGTVIPLSIPIDQPYQFDVSVRYLDGEHSGGILFNAQQPGTRQKSHMARFNMAENAWWLMYGYFDDGSAFIGQGSVRLDITPRDPAPHMLGVQVNGSVYTLFIDGQPVATDIPLQYQGGGVGLITAAAQVAFDDLRVEPLAQSEATPQPAAQSQPELTHVPSAADISLYGTNFTEDGAGTQWMPMSGVWTVEPGAMVQTQPEGFDLATVLNVPFTTPYTLHATLRHRQGIGGGVLFNLAAVNDKNGSTMVRYFDDGSVIAWGYFDAAGAFNGQGNATVSVPGTDAHTLEITVESASYRISLDGVILAENVPLMNTVTPSYIGMTASQSVTAFESVNVTAPDTAPATTSLVTGGINTTAAVGDWQVNGASVIQQMADLTDYFAGTGIAAETFTLSVDVQLPADNPQAGGGVLFHMTGRDTPSGGAMVRFGSGGSEVFWGEYNADGIFAGTGGAPLTATPGDLLTLQITVRSSDYDVRVNGTVIAEGLPITRTDGWIGLISFSGPVTFSNIQLTMGGM